MKHNLKQLNQDFDEPLLSDALSIKLIQSGYDENQTEWHDGELKPLIPIAHAVQWLYINFDVWIACDPHDDFFVSKVFVREPKSERFPDLTRQWKLISKHVANDLTRAYNVAIQFCFPLESIHNN